MRIADLLSQAITGLRVHKGRFLLTILGIVIGIASVVAVTSAGEVVNGLVLSQFQNFSPGVVFVLPGKEPTGIAGAAGTLLNDSLTEKDYEDLRERTPGVRRVVPFVFGSASAEHESETFKVTALGSTPAGAESFDLRIADGRFFTESEVDDATRVIVLGSRVKDELFGLDSALDKKIRIKDIPFRVVGVLEQKSGSFISFDESIYAPYPPIQRDILGIRHFNRIAVEANNPDEVHALADDIRRLLDENHNIEHPDDRDFSVQTRDDVAESVGAVTLTLTVLLILVAGISLVVGGVGIMNVMFVSVAERTREIGLRKALGAKKSHILLQFLIESMVLTLSGGLLGVLLGIGFVYAAVWAIGVFSGVSASVAIAWSGAWWGVLLSLAIGLLFGVFPARSAAQKSPMEALSNY